MTRRVLMALLALQAALVLWHTRTTTWIWDDVYNLQLAHETTLTGAYLARPIFGQLVPGYKAVQWVLCHTWGMWYLPVRLIGLALACACTIQFVRLARALGAAEWAISAGAVLLVLQPAAYESIRWWAACLHTMPTLLATISLTLAMVAPVQTVRTRVTAAAWLAFGLAFQGKVLVGAAFAMALVAYLHQGGLAAKVRAALGGALWFASVLVAYLPSAMAAHDPTPFRVVDLALWTTHALGQGTLAPLLGLGNWGGWGWTMWVALAVWSALALLAARGQGGRRALALLGLGLGYVACSAALIATQRSKWWAPEYGASLRYNVESASIMLLVSTVAVSRIRLPRVYRTWAQVVLVAVVANLAVQVNTHTDSLDRWAKLSAIKAYLGTFPAAYRAGAVKPTALVPRTIVPLWVADDHRTAFALASLMGIETRRTP